MHDMQFAIERLISRTFLYAFFSTSTMNVNSFRRTENRKKRKKGYKIAIVLMLSSTCRLVKICSVKQTL